MKDRTMAPRPDVAEQVRAARLRAGLSLEELARRAGIGVRTLGDVERAVAKRPQRATLTAIIEALGLQGPERRAVLEARLGPDGPATAPVLPDRVVGRDTEVDQVRTALTAPEPLVIITGAPGLGKSTLALEALRDRAADTVLFLSLDGQSASPRPPVDLVREAVQRLTGEDAPAVLDAAVAAWAAAQASLAPVLVLDDAGTEAQVRPFLTVAGRGAVLVTSRRSLAGLDNPERVVLGPLEDGPAAAMLSAFTGLELGRDTEAALVRACAGSPLALRIIAGQLNAEPDGAEVLADGLARTQIDTRALRYGDVSIDAAIAPSYADLPSELAETFTALALLEDSDFGAAVAALATGTDPDDAEDDVDALVDRGLVDALQGGRFRLHDLVRRFALARRTEVEGAETVSQRRSQLHARLRGVLDQAASVFDPSGRQSPVFSDQAAARTWLVAEERHWSAAIRDADPKDLLRSVSSLQWFSNFWPAWGHWHELFGRAVEVAVNIGDDVAVAEHLGHQTWAALMEQGDRATALEHAEAARAAAGRIGEVGSVAWADYHVGWALLALRRPAEALGHIEAARSGFSEVGDEAQVTQLRSMAGAARHLLGEHRPAISDFAAVIEAMGTDPSPGARFSTVVALEETAKCQNALIEYEDVLSTTRQGLELAEGLSWDTGSARLLRQRAEAFIGLGRAEEAHADLDRAEQLVDASRRDAQAVAVSSELQDLRARLLDPTRADPR